MNAAEFFGDEAVTAHGEEGAGLGVEHDEEDGGEAADGAGADDGGAEVVAKALEYVGGGGRGVEFGVGEDAGHNGADGDIEEGGEGEGGDDADGHVTGGVAGFFGGGGEGVEAEVGEKEDGGAGGDACPAVGEEGFPVGGIDMGAGHEKEEEDGANFYIDEGAVGGGAFANAVEEEVEDDHDDEDGGQVDDAAFGWHGGEGVGNFYADVFEDADEVGGPATGDGAGANGVFEDE